MSIARDIMHMGAECIDENETLAAAAQKMHELHVGALPICGQDNRLHGIITDRDIVIRCIAVGNDPLTMTAGQLARGTPIWVDVNADATEVVNAMTEHQIRRVPVLGEHELVGMISEADLATHLDEHQLSQFASAIYSAPANDPQ
jgi:CBS domain-containing protein